MDRIPFFKEFLRRARLSSHPFPRWVYARVRAVYRVLGRTLWFLGLGWVDSVRRITRDGDGWTVEGWAYHRGTDFGPDREFRAWLKRRGRRIEVPAQVRYDLEARAAARAAEFDYAQDAFGVRIDDSVLDGLPLDSRWRLVVEIRGNGHRVRGVVRRVSLTGSAAVMGLELDRVGHLLGPDLDRESGLWFVKQAVAATASTVRVTSSQIEIELVPGSSVRAARWVGVEQQPQPGTVSSSDGVTSLTLPVPVWSSEDWVTGGDPKCWSLEVEAQDGGTHQVVLTEDTVVERAPGAGAFVRVGRRHEVELVVTPVRVVVDSAEIVTGDPRALRLAGSWVGVGRFELEFRSRFVTLPVDLTIHPDGRFEAVATLALSRWGGPLLPPPRGRYTLVARVGADVHPTQVDRSLGATMPQAYPTEQYRLRLLTVDRGQLSLAFGPPRTDDEFGAWRQLQLRERYMTSEVAPLDAVYFESFFGRNATCNPAAMDAELARRDPAMPRYWGVEDLSVVVPEGATPLVRGTAEWWRIRGSARWLVTNEWLRGNYVKRPFQTVLQTWHGSMYKQIGLDRVGRGKAHLKVVERERSQWDLFVSQAAETTPIIRRAYGLTDQVIETGYPRNDELTRSTEEIRAALRARIGIPEGKTVVLYAPTWREAVQEDVVLLDLERLGAVLGPDFVLLRRGHVRSLRTMTASQASNVIDVSTYPQINHLQHVADVLITDYSSMMFDFSATGRPLIFYTPDIDDYTDTRVRGAYFDLESRAPGPVTRETAEVVRLLRTLQVWPPEWKDRYAAWQERYNHLDDGLATTRALDALFAYMPEAHHGTSDEGVSDADLDMDDIVAGETEGPPSEGARLDTDEVDDSTASG
ncbi:MAG: CDP-glycerol:poly(glycerophosphate) glycerophosphotransferase [Aeromicrobium sp.]|nr:CDP-glycerol:poly(glycerophosphate) glycerophosphotransferase [Aeromicrobium sp.]